MSSSYDDFARYTLQAEEAGASKERERIVVALEDYFESALFIEPNVEWDAGFQAAIALIKGETE